MWGLTQPPHPSRQALACTFKPQIVVEIIKKRYAAIYLYIVSNLSLLPIIQADKDTEK